MIAVARLVLGLCCVSACAGAATGQFRRAIYPTDLSLTRQPVAIEKVVARFVEQAPRQTKALLATPLMSREEEQQGSTLAAAHNHCIHDWVELRMPIPVMRGAIAEQWFAREPVLLDNFAAAAPRQIGRIPLVDGRPFVVGYAACVAAANPKGAVRLLKAPRGSAVERGSFVQLGSVLKDCMPLHANYRVNIAGFRDELASIAVLMAIHAPTGA